MPRKFAYAHGKADAQGHALPLLEDFSASLAVMDSDSIKVVANRSAGLSKKVFIPVPWQANVAPVVVANLLSVGKAGRYFRFRTALDANAHGDGAAGQPAQEYLAAKLTEEEQICEEKHNLATAVARSPLVWKRVKEVILAQCSEWNAVTQEETLTCKETAMGDLRIWCAARSKQMTVHYDSKKLLITIKNAGWLEHEKDLILRIEGYRTGSNRDDRDARWMRNELPANMDMLILGELRLLTGIGRQGTLRIKERSAHTLAAYRLAIADFLNFTLGLAMAEVTHHEMSEWLHFLKERGLSARSRSSWMGAQPIANGGDGAVHPAFR